LVILETERLIIRNFQTNEWQALHEIIVQYQASEYAAYDQQWPTSREEIKGVTEWFASGDNFLAVCLNNTSQLIGFVGLNPEEGRQGEFNIGYVFDFDFHSRGYATEACYAILSRAFDQFQADRVVTGTAAVNLPSRRLLERLGFQKIGEERTTFKVAEDGKPIEFLGYHYAIARNDWVNRKS
jgi:RimJ/RimL family protein N-acetyltransferase